MNWFGGFIELTHRDGRVYTSDSVSFDQNIDARVRALMTKHGLTNADIGYASYVPFTTSLEVPQ